MTFKKIKNKLCWIFLLTIICIIPINTYAYSNKLLVGGQSIGIEVKSKGILVIGFYKVGNTSPGIKAKLKKGDRIIKIGEQSINKIDEISKTVDPSTKDLKITYIRNNKEQQTTLHLKKDKDNIIKTGIYVKDKITGIGTLTYVDPNTKKFAALGHEIIEQETKQRFEIANGKIFKSRVDNIDKSTRNNPGGKNASFYQNITLGTITNNEISGIYGKYKLNTSDLEELEVANIDEITPGKATIKTVITKDKVETFNINILSINKDHDTKNLNLEITDEKLLNATNGIVQGMSGSPIIQNNKLIGAVTHVIVDNPKQGYGIFITNMQEGSN